MAACNNSLDWTTGVDLWPQITYEILLNNEVLIAAVEFLNSGTEVKKLSWHIAVHENALCKVGSNTLNGGKHKSAFDQLNCIILMLSLVLLFVIVSFYTCSLTTLSVQLIFVDACNESANEQDLRGQRDCEYQC